MKCKKCNKDIVQGRVDLGYKVCVDCSTIEFYSTIAITYHKTGNTIQIMSKKQSKRIRKLTERRGYGTMLKNI